MLKLGKIARRVSENYKAKFSYTPELVQRISERCTEVDTGPQRRPYSDENAPAGGVHRDPVRMAQGNSIAASACPSAMTGVQVHDFVSQAVRARHKAAAGNVLGGAECVIRLRGTLRVLKKCRQLFRDANENSLVRSGESGRECGKWSANESHRETLFEEYHMPCISSSMELTARPRTRTTKPGATSCRSVGVAQGGLERRDRLAARRHTVEDVSVTKEYDKSAEACERFAWARSSPNRDSRHDDVRRR